jgi:hypothetical protein
VAKREEGLNVGFEAVRRDTKGQTRRTSRCAEAVSAGAGVVGWLRGE